MISRSIRPQRSPFCVTEGMTKWGEKKNFKLTSRRATSLTLEAGRFKREWPLSAFALSESRHSAYDKPFRP